MVDEDAMASIEAEFVKRCAKLKAKHKAETLWGVPRDEWYAVMEWRKEQARVAFGRDPKSGELVRGAGAHASVKTGSKATPEALSSVDDLASYLGVRA